jgi:hypothetical protein
MISTPGKSKYLAQRIRLRSIPIQASTEKKSIPKIILFIQIIHL